MTAARRREAVLDLLGITGELLTEAHRHRVLKVSAADLHHPVELLGLALQRVGQALEGRLQLTDDGEVGRDVDGRGDDVVATTARC